MFLSGIPKSAKQIDKTRERESKGRKGRVRESSGLASSTISIRTRIFWLKKVQQTT